MHSFDEVESFENITILVILKLFENIRVELKLLHLLLYFTIIGTK